MDPSLDVKKALFWINKKVQHMAVELDPRRPVKFVMLILNSVNISHTLNLIKARTQWNKLSEAGTYLFWCDECFGHAQCICVLMAIVQQGGKETLKGHLCTTLGVGWGHLDAFLWQTKDLPPMAIISKNEKRILPVCATHTVRKEKFPCSFPWLFRAPLLHSTLCSTTPVFQNSKEF